MPESLTDRTTCHKCQYTGSKKLSKCADCHSVTYCSQECQRDDWDRHRDNCVPVMITEYEGKGRGLVASRDIEMGELIFNDKAVITMLNPNGRAYEDNRKFLMDQIGKLSDEQKAQFYSLMPHKEYANIRILEELKIFAGNSKPLGDDERIFLNLALINHSCSPNATFGKLQELEEDNNNAESHQSALGSLQAGLSSLFAAFSFSNPSVNPKKMKVELRAVKDILKGEEITICYLDAVDSRETRTDRKNMLREEFAFVCKCKVCSGEIRPNQDDTLKRILYLRRSLRVDAHNVRMEERRRQALQVEKIFELVLQLHVCRFEAKLDACYALARMAHLARDPELRQKGLDAWKELVDNSRFEQMRLDFEEFEEFLNRWSRQFNSKRSPTRDEVNFYCLKKLNHF